MALSVKINNVEKLKANDAANPIETLSFQVKKNLYSRPNSCSFRYVKYGAKEAAPDGDDEVEAWDGATKIFGGVVVRRRETAENPLSLGGDVGYVVNHDIECKDWSERLNRKNVFESYEEKTVDYIVNDIITKYTSGFTQNNVNCSVEIKKAVFKGKSPSQCLDELAGLVGYYWYVDDAKDIHFFASGDELAPFSLTDTSKNYEFRSLELVDDWLTIKNVINIEGGTFKSSVYITQDLKVMENSVDEDRRIFDTITKFAEKPQVFLDDDELSVGVANLEREDDYDVLWDFNQKSIKFRDDNKPGLFDKLTLKGYEAVPVVFRATDSISAYAYGERHSFEIDRSLKTINQASQKAAAMLTAWKDKITDGSFTTYTAGLKPGQRININSTIRGRNQNFIIKSVSFSVQSAEKLKYRIELITQETADLIDILQKQILDKSKELEIDENAQITRFIQADENIYISENCIKDKGEEGTAAYGPYGYGPYWLIGSYWSYLDWPYNPYRVPVIPFGPYDAYQPYSGPKIFYE